MENMYGQILGMHLSIGYKSEPFFSLRISFSFPEFLEHKPHCKYFPKCNLFGNIKFENGHQQRPETLKTDTKRRTYSTRQSKLTVHGA